MPVIDIDDSHPKLRMLLQRYPIKSDPTSLWKLSYDGAARLEHKLQKPLFLQLDYLHGAMGYRARHAQFKNEAVVKALGIKSGKPMHVIDATAGLGRDSLLMLCAGAQVTQIEQHPVLALMLDEAKRRAADHDDRFSLLSDQCCLVHGDALALLPKLSADAVYLDPMYPLRKKSALVKREMQVLHALLPSPPDPTPLLEAALQCDCKRVVVKRPKTATALAAEKRSGSINIGATRFDIYQGGA